jgi:UMF1 family MFS transporter
MKPQNAKKSVVSWILYDCANSVFYTTVMAGFFPIFFKKYWSLGADESLSTQRLGWILAISGFALAVLSPLLGVISDKKKYKKILLGSFMLMGVLCTLALAYIPEGQWYPAAVVYGFALLFCTASTIFYDSLLVSVADPKDYDMVSSLGYAFGYLAGGVLFSVNVLMYLQPELFGIATPVAAVLLSFVTVAVWWFLFSIPILLYVEEPTHELSDEKISLLVKHSMQQLYHTALKIFENKNLFYFLIAYWFYIDGVSTVMAMAVDFGVAINLDSGSLIKALLLVQFVGFPSAYMAGKLAGKFSSREVILASIFVYILAVIGASQMSTELHFYIMACCIGLAQGSIQALSRSLFAQLIPVDSAGEYFGFFNLLGKFASVLGPILMAVSTILFKNAQYAILSLLILFVIGFYYLLKVKSRTSPEVS